MEDVEPAVRGPDRRRARTDLVGERRRPPAGAPQRLVGDLPAAGLDAVGGPDPDLGERLVGAKERPEPAVDDGLREDHDVAHVRFEDGPWRVNALKSVVVASDTRTLSFIRA